MRTLQIQLEPLKRPEGAHRRYDPGAIRLVDRLSVEPSGVKAQVAGQVVLDVHHANHPRTRHREGLNGLSLGFTSHYREIRDRFGGEIREGVGGENLLVECEGRVTLDDLSGRLELRNSAGIHRLVRLRVAEPCEPFATFLLGREPGQASPEELKAALQTLRMGLRGFYAAWEGGEGMVQIGDELWVE